MKESLKMLLMIRKSKGIKPKHKKPPKWLFPTNAEKHYDRVLYSLVNEMKRQIVEVLYPEIPSMIREVEGNTPNDRQDNYLTRLNAIILHLRASIQDKVNQTQRDANAIGLEVNSYNKRQSEKLNESIFGFDIFVGEPWLQDQLELFSAQNANLISSIPNEELGRVAGTVERGLQQGLRFTEIQKEIQKSFGITHRRAKLIARDQVTKLNASLTKLRQEELGIDEYEWQTAGDERVRPTHRANDGKRFRWDKPPAKTGHPGHDINCRCVAIPVLDKLLNLR